MSETPNPHDAGQPAEPSIEPNAPPPDVSVRRDSDIGDAKPPKGRQFKKGQSGNPKGRPKKKRIEDLSILIDEILQEPVASENGESRSKFQAMMEAQSIKAMKGDPKAARRLLRMTAKANMVSKAIPHSSIVLTPPVDEHKMKMLALFHAEQEADASVTKAVDRSHASSEGEGELA